MASSSQAAAARNGKGRQKVRMVKMENKSNLQVTFSKRRYGLFKKASELCTLTGAEIGVIVFSPGRKVFSFGHPSVHRIMNDCFPPENEGGPRPRHDERLVEAHRSASVAEHNMRLSLVEMQLQAEKRRVAAIEEREKAEIHAPIEGMKEEELLELGAKLHALRDRVMRLGRQQQPPQPVQGEPGLNPYLNPAELNPVNGLVGAGFGFY